MGNEERIGGFATSQDQAQTSRYAGVLMPSRADKIRHAPLMPKDKHGEHNRREFEVYWECSNCDHELRGGMRDPAAEWKYCPYCGALFNE